MAWTAASIVPTIGSIVTPKSSANTNRNQTLQQVSSSQSAASAGRPSFLNNPEAFLGGQQMMQPYAELLSRILQPQASPSVPPVLAEALANQAKANAERLQMQNDATRAAMELPGQITASRQREAVLAPWSLSGLPTGLGYQPPPSLLDQQANTFNLRARAFGAPAISPINSGWLSPGLY
jgi:hypothetical protein